MTFLQKAKLYKNVFVRKNNFLSALLIKFNFNQDKKFLCAKKYDPSMKKLIKKETQFHVNKFEMIF